MQPENARLAVRHPLRPATGCTERGGGAWPLIKPARDAMERVFGLCPWNGRPQRHSNLQRASAGNLKFSEVRLPMDVNQYIRQALDASDSEAATRRVEVSRLTSREQSQRAEAEEILRQFPVWARRARIEPEVIHSYPRQVKVARFADRRTGMRPGRLGGRPRALP